MSDPPWRGEVWLVDFDPVEGREQGGRRPALILSVDQFNASGAELVAVLPITSKQRPFRTRLEVPRGEGGLLMTSYVICEQLRTISTRRLGKKLGTVSALTLSKVVGVVRVIFGLDLS